MKCLVDPLERPQDTVAVSPGLGDVHRDFSEEEVFSCGEEEHDLELEVSLESWQEPEADAALGVEVEGAAVIGVKNHQRRLVLHGFHVLEWGWV